MQAALLLKQTVSAMAVPFKEFSPKLKSKLVLVLWSNKMFHYLCGNKAFCWAAIINGLLDYCKEVDYVQAKCY